MRNYLIIMFFGFIVLGFVSIHIVLYGAYLNKILSIASVILLHLM